MRVLARKVLRDVGANRRQAVLIVLIIAFGVGIYASMAQSASDLHASYDATYARLDYMDLDVLTMPVPGEVVEALPSQLPGTTAAEGRWLEECSLRVEDGRASGLLIGLNASRRPRVNDVKVTSGTYLRGEGQRVLVEKHFADFHGIGPGDAVSVRAANSTLELEVDGVVMSPEYLWVVGDPEQLFPMEGTFGVLFVPLGTLQDLVGAPGMVNDVSLTSRDRQATRDAVLNHPVLGNATLRIDEREDKWSYWALQEDLRGFDEMTPFMSALVLLIGGFTISMTMSRLVSSQRRQVGVLRAMGAGPGAVVAHFLALALLLGLAGSLLGTVLGAVLSYLLLDFYGSILGIPVIAYDLDPGILLLAVAFGLAVVLVFSAHAAWRASRMTPREAMLRMRLDRPGELSGRATRGLGLSGRFALRNLLRRKARTLLTVLGVAAAMVLAISMVAMLTSIDATIADEFDGLPWSSVASFTGDQPASVAGEVRAVPGVKEVEPYLRTSAQVDGSYYPVEGVPEDGQLMAYSLSEGSGSLAGGDGIIVDRVLSEEQGLHPGDRVTLLLPGGVARTYRVTGVNSRMIGGSSYVSLEDLRSSLGRDEASGVYVQGDPDGVEGLPFVQRVFVKNEVARNLEQLVQEFSPFIYAFLFLGALIGVVVVLNAVTINLLEREVEFATLRALGGTRGLLGAILGLEGVVVGMAGGLLSLPLGYLTSVRAMEQFSTGMFQMEVVIPWFWYPVFVAIALGATLLASIPSVRDVSRVDLAETVKELGR